MIKILVTGAEGRFGKVLKHLKSNKKFIFRNKKELNILSSNSIKKNLNKFKPNYILHLAGLSRPMSIHQKNIVKSIDLNIIGTCNLVKEASKLNIKIIYLSTSYVYSGEKGNYKESDSIKPWNNYGWSKLGGECAVKMYNNSLNDVEKEGGKIIVPGGVLNGDGYQSGCYVKPALAEVKNGYAVVQN